MVKEIKNLEGDVTYVFVEAFKAGRKAANRLWEGDYGK